MTRAVERRAGHGESRLKEELGGPPLFTFMAVASKLILASLDMIFTFFASEAISRNIKSVAKKKKNWQVIQWTFIQD